MCHRSLPHPSVSSALLRCFPFYPFSTSKPIFYTTHTNVPLLLSYHLSEDVSREVVKNRWTPREWIFVRTYPDLASAKAFLKEQKVYGPAYNDKCMITRYFRCKHTSQRSKVKCVSMAKLVLSKMSEEVNLFETKDSHNHEEIIGSKKRGIPQEMKEILSGLLDKGMTTSQINTYLFNEGMDAPTGKQITAYKAEYRKRTNGPALTKLAQFQEWCIAHHPRPDTEDGAFVFKYEVVYPDTDEAGKQCRAFLTTKKLILNTANAYTLHADGTHKLVTTGFPGLVLGTTDADAKFNLIAICVCPCETIDDYVFMFTGLKEAAEHYGIQLNIT